MGKFDFSNTIDKLKEAAKKDMRRAAQFGIGDNLAEISTDLGDYVVLPEWWKDHFGVPGLRFGNIVQIAGDSDTGKTSLALLAIRCAQEQGFGVVYVETEGKTGEADLIAAGIDPKGVLTYTSAITEEAFDGGLKLWNQFFIDYPKEKLLFVYDSYGNTVSMRDVNLDLLKENQKPGGAAKVNRMGVNTMVARMQTDPVAILIVNYTYDNIGSVGKINAGGKALNFFSMLSLQSQKLGFLEATRQGVKVRLGAKFKWRVHKNHYAKSLKDADGKQILLPAECKLQISDAGFQLIP